MKISCWNVNSARVRQHHIEQYLQEEKPDYLFLQELKMEEKDFPKSTFASLGYESYVIGQKTYNGVAILTNQKSVEIEYKNLPHLDHPEAAQARFIQLKDVERDISLINIYLPNGNPVFSEEGMFHEKFTYKLAWMEALYEHVKIMNQKQGKFLIAGDFNIAPFDEDIYHDILPQNEALVRKESRGIYFKMLHLGLTDALKQHQLDPEYTWWDYRAGSMAKNQGMRIDHFLLSPQMADILKEAGMHKDYRLLEKPSDHAPIYVIMEN